MKNRRNLIDGFSTDKIESETIVLGLTFRLFSFAFHEPHLHTAPVVRYVWFRLTFDSDNICFAHVLQF